MGWLFGTRSIGGLVLLLSIGALAGCVGPGSVDPPLEVDRGPYDGWLERAIEIALPGFVLAVDRPGEEPWLGAAGQADLREPRALTAEDPFHLASVTKSITADRGELDLTDRIVELLPEPLVAGLPAVERVTVRSLLEHSSGLYSFNNDRDYWGV